MERKFVSADVEIVDPTPIVLSAMERSVAARGAPPIRRNLNSTHFHGTRVPVEEPSTAS
jgi:hypothetical protein